MKFRLLTGRHVHKGRMFQPGEIVESNADLVKLHGREHFAKVSGEPDANYEAPVPLGPTSSEAPGGQVSSGHQMTTGAPDGVTQVSGAEDRLRPDGLHPETVVDKPDEGKSKASHPVAKTATTTAPKALPANLDHMTQAQLKEFANEEEIDLEGATNRADMIKAIRASRK